MGKFCLKNLILFYHHLRVTKRLLLIKKNIVNELNKLVVQKDKIINKALFKKYFGSKGLNDVEMEL